MRIFRLYLLSAILLGSVLSCATGNLSSTTTTASTNSLTLVGYYSNGTEILKSIVILDDDLYSAAGYDGLFVFDITGLSATTVTEVTQVGTGYSKTGWPVNDVKAVSTGNATYPKVAIVAYGSANSTGGIGILGVEDPANITNFVEAMVAGRSANAVALSSSGDFVYVADAIDGIIINEVDYSTDPPSITERTNFTLFSGSPVDLFLDDNYLYVAAGQGGIYIIDVNAWASIEIVANIVNSLSMVNSVYIAGTGTDRRLVAADRMNGVLIYNIGNVKEPNFLKNYDTTGDFYHLTVKFSDIFVADGINGVFKINLDTVKYLGGYDEFGPISYKIVSFSTFIGASYGPDGLRFFDNSQ